MSVIQVRIYGDPILLKPVKPVINFDGDLIDLVDDMIDTMREYEGIGLAANQVGVSLSLMVIDLNAINENYSPLPIVNIEFLEKDGSVVGEEGCLSLPGIRENIERAQHIKIRYQDIFGETMESEFQDLIARVIQHEYDHLQGKLLVDHISPMRKKFLNPKLQKLSKESAANRVHV